MWIRGRFSATSKRGSHSLFGIVCVVIAHLLSGCVVTDKITFEEAENNPIALWPILPEEHITAVNGDETINFTVKVMDPDIYDSDNPEIGALLTYSTSYWESREEVCQNSPIPVPEEENPFDVDGVVFEIVCPLDLNSFGFINDTILSVTMTVSDLGFQQHSHKPRKGAQLVTHNWGLQIASE
jgi:hypothetical protein